MACVISVKQHILIYFNRTFMCTSLKGKIALSRAGLLKLFCSAPPFSKRFSKQPLDGCSLDVNDTCKHPIN